MSDLVEALDRLVDAHRRIGSPLPEFLLPGVPARTVVSRFGELGLSVPGEVLELFAWHNGTADRLDSRPVALDPGLACDIAFPTLDKTIATYRERRVIDDVGSHYQGEPHTPVWRRTWLPLFAGSYFLDCEAPRPEAVYEWRWHPPAEGWEAPRFRDLTHVIRSLVRRFEAGSYSMGQDEDGCHILVGDNEILAALHDIEIKEASVAPQR